MRCLGPVAAAGVMLVSLCSMARAAPPAPVPPQIAVVADALPRAYNDGKSNEYAALFADSLQVYDGAIKTAASKAEWLALVQGQIQSGWTINVIDRALSWNQILLVEQVTHGRGLVIDPEMNPRAALYTITNGKISEVRLLTNWAGGYFDSQVAPRK